MFFFADVAESGGFMGIFENNLINWLLLVASLWWLMSTKLPPVFKGREDGIKATLNQALKAREEAQALLEKQKAAVANAEVEAENILERSQACSQRDATGNRRADKKRHGRASAKV
jgi:F0F1-type ATP synthase membrane subunit b/b'